VFENQGGGSDDDTLDRPEWIWSVTYGGQRRNKAWTSKLAQDALALPAPDPTSKAPQDPLALPAPKRQPTPMSSDAEDQGFQTEDQKRCSRLGKRKAVAASPRAPAEQRKGTKVPPPTLEQQDPKTPMVTRRQEASRAGGLRPGSGSGQTDTRVAQGTLPKPES
jgi:hypothetical protein